MSNFHGVWITLLRDAVDAGRAAMRELDGPEIPAGLQRVAAYSGGSLPPPLAASLLSEIDANDWFRGKVLDVWDGSSETASGLFLERPDAWWIDLAAAAADAEANRGAAQLAVLKKQLGKAEEKWRRAADKLGDQKRELEAAKRRAKELVESARTETTARFQAEADELATVRKRSAALADRMERLEKEHRELQDAFVSLRRRFARGRRYRIDTPSGDTALGSLPSDPVKLARLLDLQTASFGRAPQTPPPREIKVGTTLTLAPGVRPDSADAIRWLISLDEPVVVLVDGYNAQFHIDKSDFTSGAARSNLVGALLRIRKAGAVRHRIVAVFDSTLPGDRVARSALGGVEVRFTEQDVIADEEIVAMVEHLDRVVVISSDREVREGSEDGGAVVLWSEALAEWLKRM
jgi:predicted RNA-binding protein with PIN domain